MPSCPGGYTVAVVCDGMGGVAGGSIASSVAVETYIRTLTETVHSGHPDQAVHAAVMAANSAIRQRAAGHPELRSMGTTLVSALVKGDRVLISNVGDSRAYLAGAQGLRQISRDHSLVEDMVEKGDLTPVKPAAIPAAISLPGPWDRTPPWRQTTLPFSGRRGIFCCCAPTDW
ncbi:MAG: protein phosphatase 2C domain-containing protein [Oscillospiraceae bacterium]